MIHAVPLFLAIALTFTGATAQAKELKELVQEIQQPMTITGVMSRDLSVEFNHTSHSGIPCLNCHHERKDGNRFVPCRTCHDMCLFTAFHSRREGERSCYACHALKVRDERGSFGKETAGCGPCHEVASTKGAPVTKNVSVRVAAEGK